MDKKQLRAIGHQLKPVVTLGQKGITDSLLEEIGRALHDHELIKVKIAGDDREQRKALEKEICEACGAELIQSVGKISLILRRSAKPNPKTSNLIRMNQPG